MLLCMFFIIVFCFILSLRIISVVDSFASLGEVANLHTEG